MEATATITAADQLYLDACKALGKPPHTLEQYAHHEEDAQAFFSLHRITTVIKARKAGHVFDWNNDDEYKYYPWADMETYGDAPAGSGFSLDAVDCDLTASNVGARLSSKTRDDAREIFETMIEDYKNWMKE